MIDLAFPFTGTLMKTIGEADGEKIKKTIVGAPIYIEDHLLGAITDVDEENEIIEGTILYDPVVTVVNGFVTSVVFAIRDRINIEEDDEEKTE